MTDANIEIKTGSDESFATDEKCTQKGFHGYDILGNKIIIFLFENKILFICIFFM